MADKVQNSALFYEKYLIDSEIGRGASGVCYKIKRISDAKTFALKKISSNSIKKNNMKAAYNQVAILSSLQHPNIIKYYESFMDEQDLYIVMQYAQKGDLHSILKKRKIKIHYYEEHQLWTMIGQLLNGLQYLHNKNIIHRDVKTLNIFVDDSNKVIIGDLGVSKIVKSDLGLYSRVGTPLYLPPEIIKYEKYDFKADVWGLGCVSYLLATLNHPFEGKNIISLGQNIVNKDPKPIERYSQILQNLIFEMLEKNHTKRLSPSMLLKKYFSDNERLKKIEKPQIKKPIQNPLIEADFENEAEQKKQSEKVHQRRYLISKKMQKEVEISGQSKNNEQKGLQSLRNQKKFRYMIGNFISDGQNGNKQKSEVPISSYKTFENTIVIKPSKIFKEEDQFKNGNQQVTKIQKESSNSIKKFILSSQNIKKKEGMNAWKMNGSEKKFQGINKVESKGESNKIWIKHQLNIERRSEDFESLKQKNSSQSVQRFTPFGETEIESNLVSNQIYAEKKLNLLIRKMPTETKHGSETQNLRRITHYSVANMSQNHDKIFTRNLNTSGQKIDKQQYIDVLKITNEASFCAQKLQAISKNRYRQRPKSSIGKKQQKYTESSCLKPKRKENLYSNFYSIVETRVLKKPEVILL